MNLKMMNPKIQQQQAAIELIKMQVAAKRARPEKLEAAINELNRLKSEAIHPEKTSAPTHVPRQSKLVKEIMKDVKSDPVELRQSALSEEANRLRKEQAELSNMLHKVPKEQDCAELTSRILGLHEQIESVWDQKKFLDRNLHDGPMVPAHDQQVTVRSLDEVQTKAQLTVTIQRLREKVSKLKSKLKSPKSSEKSKTEWEIELSRAQAAIDEALTNRALL